MTTNRAMGVLTGVLITALIQSSSATAVVVVNFVNAGLLTSAESINVIMGANIGMAVTAWVISIFRFKIDIAAFALPLLVITLPLVFSGKNNRKSIGEFIFGFSFLFTGLSYLKANTPNLNANPGVLAFVQNYTDMGFFPTLLFLFVGTMLAMIVRASAAMMAVTLIMYANSQVSLELGAALVLDKNIGTAIAASLAALTTNIQAKRVALAHFVFNVSDVAQVLIIPHSFMELVSWMADAPFQSNNPKVTISYKLSALHSIFNIYNVCILIQEVKLVERTVYALIHPKEEDEESRPRFITGSMPSTAKLSILQTRKGVHLFAKRTHHMFRMVQGLMHTERDDDFNKLFSRVEKYENTSDNMELEIANCLNQVSEGRLSSESKLQIRVMLRGVTKIEGIGGSYYNLARIINRKRQANQDFTEKQYEHIHFMMKLTDDALAWMIVVVEKPKYQSTDINKSFGIESEINNYRNQLKNQNIPDVSSKEYDYQMGVYYVDIIAECEKLSDYVMDMIEANSDIREKKAF